MRLKLFDFFVLISQIAVFSSAALVLSYSLRPQCGRTADSCSECSCRCISSAVLNTRPLLPRLLLLPLLPMLPLLPLLLLLVLLLLLLLLLLRRLLYEDEYYDVTTTTTTTTSTATATATTDAAAATSTHDHACYRIFGKSRRRWLLP